MISRHGKTCATTPNIYCTHDAADLHALIGSMDIPEDENEVHVVIRILVCNIPMQHSS